MGLVIITGCNGFIGRATASALAAEHKVIGFDDHAPKSAGPLTEFVPCDVTDGASIDAALMHVLHGYGQHIASVIHLAAYYDFSGEPSPKYEAVTIRGTERLLDSLSSFELDQFVFSSTMLVHAPAPPGSRISEESPIEPKWDYPKSKWETEELVRIRGQSLRHVILRIAGVYDAGCHSPPLANQIQRIYERRLVSRVFPGDVTHGQAFVHLDDVVDAFARLIRLRDQLGPSQTFLLGEPETVSYGELQRSFGRLLHEEEWTTNTIPKPVAKAGAWVEEHVPGEEPFIKPWMIDLADDHFELDITRARQRLGWNPVRNLRATLPSMIQRLKADPVSWYHDNKLELPTWLREPRHESAVPHPLPG